MFRFNDGKTRIEWTYRTIPTNFFARIFHFRVVLIRFFKKMLQQAMDISKNDLETGNLVGDKFPARAGIIV